MRGRGGLLRRTVGRRLIEPLRRARSHPEHTARGVLFGLLIALTPTVGVQMPVTAVVWLAVRRLRPQWDFNVFIALAWCWVTNVATAPPLYYLYIVTGRIMLGRTREMQGYEAFSRRLAEALPTDAGWLETVYAYLTNLLVQFGAPLFIGSVPWTLLGAWIGYRWSLRMLRHEWRKRGRSKSRNKNDARD